MQDRTASTWTGPQHTLLEPDICPLHIQAKSPQQLSSFSAPFSFFIYSLIPLANLKHWFCARPCAGVLHNVKARVDDWAEVEGAVVSWVCGDHGAGVGTESQRQADRGRALLVSPSCLAQSSPPSPRCTPPSRDTLQPLPAGILSQQNFWLLPLSHLCHFGHPWQNDLFLCSGSGSLWKSPIHRMAPPLTVPTLDDHCWNLPSLCISKPSPSIILRGREKE